MKTVVVTGGSRGIGAAIVRVFLANGWYVVVGARKESDIGEVLAEQGEFVAGDVCDRQAHNRLIETAVARTGRLDAYVNCAGVSIWRPCPEVDEDFWHLLMDTNAKGTFWGCQAAIAQFEQQGDGGAIVNVSSLAGKRGSANNAVYCASKFAVNGITQALAKEAGRQQIRVNAVCPVYVETAFLREQLAQGNSPAGEQTVDDYLSQFAATQSALRRLPLAAEVGELVLYLSSKGASAISGQCINVDCGVLPQ